MQAIDNLLTSFFLRDRVVGKLQCDHDERNVLGGVRLGGGHTDFRSGVDVDTTVGLPRQSRTDSVDDTEAQSTTLQAVSHGEDGVGCFTRLRDKDGDIVPEDGCSAVQKVRGEFDGDRDLGQFLEDGSNLMRESDASLARRKATTRRDSRLCKSGN